MIERYHVQKDSHSHFHVFIEIDICIYYILHVYFCNTEMKEPCNNFVETLIFDTIQ